MYEIKIDPERLNHFPKTVPMNIRESWKEKDPHLQGLGPERIAIGGSYVINVSRGIERFICFPSDQHPYVGFRLALVRAQ